MHSCQARRCIEQPATTDTSLCRRGGIYTGRRSRQEYVQDPVPSAGNEYGQGGGAWRLLLLHGHAESQLPVMRIRRSWRSAWLQGHAQLWPYGHTSFRVLFGHVGLHNVSGRLGIQTPMLRAQLGLLFGNSGLQNASAGGSASGSGAYLACASGLRGLLSLRPTVAF